MKMIEVIRLIEENSVLYDLSHPLRKDTKLKERLWNEIAEKVNVDVSVLKSKWKNLRDCYKKHITSLNRKHDQTVSCHKYKYWQWAKHMDFMRPHLRCPKPNDTITYYTSDLREELQEEADVELLEIETIDKIPKRRKRNEEKPTKGCKDHDAVEHIFLGYAKTIKEFPLKRQIAIKLKIAKLVMEEELRALKDSESDL